MTSTNDIPSTTQDIFAKEELSDFVQQYCPDDSVSMGVDMVEIERMRKILERSQAFQTRAFSALEQSYCINRADPASHFASRFAAKEAVLKALGTGFSGGIGLRDVEVVMTSKGKPTVRLYGKAAACAQKMGVVSLPLSITYTKSEAVACALAITKASQEKTEETSDALQTLTQQFKDMRSILDEVD